MAEAYLKGIGSVYAEAERPDDAWGVFCQKEECLWSHQTIALAKQDMSDSCKPPDLLVYQTSANHWVVMDDEFEPTSAEEGEWA